MPNAALSLRCISNCGFTVCVRACVRACVRVLCHDSMSHVNKAPLLTTCCLDIYNIQHKHRYMVAEITVTILNSVGGDCSTLLTSDNLCYTVSCRNGDDVASTAGGGEVEEVSFSLDELGIGNITGKLANKCKGGNATNSYQGGSERRVFDLR